MYTEKTINIFKNPKHAGGLRGANGVGKVGNAACGDVMKIYLKIDENETIEEATFKTFGCAAAIASTDVACDLLIGKTLEEAKKIKNSEILEILGGMPANKIHCSILAEEAIAAAIENYHKRQEKLLNNENNDDENDEE